MSGSKLRYIEVFNGAYFACSGNTATEIVCQESGNAVVWHKIFFGKDTQLFRRSGFGRFVLSVKAYCLPATHQSRAVPNF
jgi:hypothetical protein